MNRVGFKDKIRLSGGNQAITFEAPQGRPDADGTVALYDSRYPRSDATKNPIATLSATRKAIDTTVTAPSGASQSNKRRATCTPPVALVAGDFVLLQNTAGQRERVEVTAKAAGYFDVAYDLAFDYDNADTIKSAVMTSGTFPSAFINDEANLREDYEAVWTYAVAGVTYTETTRWDLVREVLSTSIFDSRLLEKFPDLLRYRFRAHPSTYAPLIRAAQRDVELKLRARGYAPDRFRGNELVQHAVDCRVHYLLAVNGVHPPGVTKAEHEDFTRREWEQALTDMFGGISKVPYDVNNDGVLQTGERRVTHVKVIR